MKTGSETGAQAGGNKGTQAGAPSPALVQLGPLEQLRTGRLPRRLAQLTLGLVIYGVSMVLMIRGHLGLSPWDALHMGLTGPLTMSFGWIVIVVSFAVLVLWIPLREIPGIGTIANATLIGLVADFLLPFVDEPASMAVRFLFTVTGIFLCGLATAMYIGAQLGRGARDGLMTGLNRLTGLSLRLVRTGIEATVLVAGVVLGGFAVVGIGTLLFSLLIGPLTQAMLPWMLVAVEAPGISADTP